MRSFSSLREHCSHVELLKLTSKPSYARDKAADLGNRFHAASDLWVKGQNPFDAGLIGDSYRWFQRFQDVWTPPPGCQSELAIGLDSAGGYHEVDEPEPHQYVAKDGSPIVTAGRLDLEWLTGAELNVCDIKTGQSYLGVPWTIPQLVAQAVTALARRQALQPSAPVRWVRLGVYYARLGVFDWGDGPRSAQVVASRFHDVLAWATMTNEPRPGGHCLSCYEKKACAAFAELTEAA